MQYDIFDKLDVQYVDHSTNYWYTATVIDITSQQIKIHYDCDGDSYEDDEWIDKTSDRLASFNTHTLPITILPSISGDWNSHIIYYKQNKIQYILLCLHGDKLIHRYHINASKWEEYSNYPQEFSMRHAGRICFDNKQLRIYMAFTHEFKLKCAIFDMLLNSWTLKTCNVQHNTINYPFSYQKADLYFIPDPIQEIHLFFQYQHYRLTDHQSNELFQFEAITDSFHTDSKKVSSAIWCNNMQQLIAIHDKTIYHCYIKQKMQSECIWKCDNHEKIDGIDFSSSNHMVLMNENILFIFKGNYGEICCVDLLYGLRCKLIRDIPAILNRNSVVVKVNDNYIHIIDTQIPEVHIKISLMDMIPKELADYYRDNVYHPLIFGYIAELINNEELTVHIPSDIAHLILAFFPSFCE